MEKTLPKIQKNKTNKEDALIESIKDKNLRETLLFLISKNAINLNKLNSKGDFEEDIKKKIEDIIKDKYQNINENFSELRKDGKDLGVLNFKLMIIPLKIKVFLSTYEKKDIENIFLRIEEIEKEIKSLNKN